MRRWIGQRLINRYLFVFATLVAVSPLAAAPQGASKAEPPVFVTSSPMGAVVILDGKTLLSRTPLLLRGLSAGKHRVQVARRGFAPMSKTLLVSGTKPIVLDADLEGTSFDPIFAEKQKVIINGKRADYSKNSYLLPSGDYSVTSTPEALTIDPVFPAQQTMKILDLATGGFIVASLILAGQTVLNTFAPAASSGSNGNAISGGAVGVWSVTGIAALSDLFMHIQKSRFIKAYAASVQPVARSAVNLEQIYNRAQTLLASGDLAGASQLYVRILQQNNDSPYYPRALYQLAKVHSIEGDNLLATTELRIILDKYPLPDLYDKTCKSLADISYRAGDYKLALTYLDKMVFLDPLFPRAQIEEYRATIEKKTGANGTGS